MDIHKLLLTGNLMFFIGCGAAIESQRTTVASKEKSAKIEEKQPTGLEGTKLETTPKDSNGEIIDTHTIRLSANGIKSLGLSGTMNWQLEMEETAPISVSVGEEKYLKVTGDLIFDPSDPFATMNPANQNLGCVVLSLKDNVNYRENAKIQISSSGLQSLRFTEVSLPIAMQSNSTITLKDASDKFLLDEFSGNSVKSFNTQICFEFDASNAPAGEYSGEIHIEYLLERGHSKDFSAEPILPGCMVQGKTAKGGQTVDLEWENVDATTKYRIVGIGDQSGNLGFVEKLDNSRISYTAPNRISVDKEILITATNDTDQLNLVGTCKINLIADDQIGMEDDGKAEGFVGNVYKLKKGIKKLPDFSKMTPVSTIVTSNLDIPKRKYTKGFPGVDDLFEWFGIEFKGRIYVEETGTYEFQVLSDDGSNLIIADEMVVDNDGIHPVRLRKGKIFLEEGWHPITVNYYQGPRYHIALQVSWKKLGEGHKHCKIIEPDSIMRPDL